MENPVNPMVPVNSEELPIASAVPPMNDTPQSILKKTSLLPIFKPKKKNVFISEMQYPEERPANPDEIDPRVEQEDWKKLEPKERENILLGHPGYTRTKLNSENILPLQEYQEQRDNLLNYIRNTIGYNNELKLEEFKGRLYEMWQKEYFNVINPDDEIKIQKTTMNDIQQIFQCVYDRYMGGFFGKTFQNIDRLHRRVDYIINSFIGLPKAIEEFDETRDKKQKGVILERDPTYKISPIPVVPWDPEATYNERKLKAFRKFCEQVIREQKGGRKTYKKRSYKKRTYKKRSYKKRFYKNKSCKKKYNKSCKRK